MKVYKSPPMSEAWARMEWCRAQFGGTGDPYVHYSDTQIGVDTTNLRWWRRQGHLFFRNEKDFVLYCLRWGS